MYEDHFGLVRKPFAVTPDPYFLYQSASHREALASLTCGIRQRRGFICLIGEVGTGKSTLIRALLDELSDSTRTVLITHTTVTRVEILRMILHELHMKDAGLTRVKMLRALNDFVINELRTRRPPPLLIIDEAQNLSEDVLEEIRLLTNLEISNSKLLQVILAGQPELDRKLQSPTLRQLHQRIAIAARLSPLGRDETVAYVLHRLRVAGSRDTSLFSREALYSIWKASGGIPRRINILCEQSLMNAYGVGKRSVDVTLAMEAVLDSALCGSRAPTAEESIWQKPLRWWRFSWS